MAVLNLNNMFPVPDGVYSLKASAAEQNRQYRTLLNNEIRIIRQKSALILANAKAVYDHKRTCALRTAPRRNPALKLPVGENCLFSGLLEADVCRYYGVLQP